MAEECKRTVLVVDDEPDAVEFVKAVLEEAGHEVITASNASECLEKALAEKPDLIILDVQMPGRDGFHAFADMRKTPQLKDTPVIMLTGIGERLGMRFSAETMGDYFGEEPEAYVEKPVDPKTLQETVRKVLGA